MLKYHLPCRHVQFYWTLGPRFLDLVSAFTPIYLYSRLPLSNAEKSTDPPAFKAKK